ncbi:hypothetical protein N0V82_003782 [Gnomoniopsis sp. IMI 355080]|nr:hypothetical protein N0V82_003782 [Gnomoniopsis sp. IMI 355080]
MDASENSYSRQRSLRQGSKLCQNSSNGLTPAQNSSKNVQSTDQTHQEWNTEVERFRIALQDAEASDETIQTAWARLRQSYRDTFNAVAHPNRRNEDLEPFPFWAAENIEEDILERVMRIEFSSSLATCLFSRLQSIASLSGLSIFTLILYFGNSFFTKGRLLAFRKRVYIFERSTSDTWPFTEGYKGMLREATLTTKAPLDTTDIPSQNMRPLFSEKLLNILAPANPEFQRGEDKNETNIAESSKTALSGIPLSKKVLSKPSQSFIADTVEDSSVRNDQGSQQTVIQDSNYYAPKRVAGQNAAQSQKDDSPLPIHHTGPDQQERSTRDCNSVLPSIESDYLVSGAPTSTPGSSKVSSAPGFSRLVTPVSQVTAHTLDGKRKSSSRKRHIKEEPNCASEINPSKRVDTATSKVDLLQTMDWDDETIILVMKQIAAIIPNDFLLVNCLGTEPEQVFPQMGGKHQTLLIPFKLKTGQRLLAVVNLIPVNGVEQPIKKSCIQYLNPACRKEDAKEALPRISADFLPLLRGILRGHSPKSSKYVLQQVYSCINQIGNEDGGLALCLAAMSVVGGLLQPPLTAQKDWMFWRHIILSSFLPENKSLQLRTKVYLEERVERQVRQIQSMRVTSHDRERPDDEVQFSRQAVVSPQERLQQRNIHAQSLLQTAQEAGHLFYNLTDHIYQARISIKHSLDMAKLQREEQRGKTTLGAEPLSRSVSDEFQNNESQGDQSAELEKIEASIRVLQARLKQAYEVHQGVKMGRDLISHYRRDIVDAVEHGS